MKLIYGPLTARTERKIAAGRARRGGPVQGTTLTNRHCNRCGHEWETALARAMRDLGPPSP